MMSLPRFRAIANHRAGLLNRLQSIYGGRIFPGRAGNAEIGRNCGFSHRQDRPARLRRRWPPARHGYTSAGGRSFVKVDCETSTTVYEGGLDKRSSLDSLQHALFFSVPTGKRPAVVIYDTDGQEGQFEYRIRTACQKSGVSYEVFR